MERVLCLLAGYVCGLFETGYFYGKMKGIDIRTKGSGNSGTTNALRVMGPKAGLIVFIGDFLKTVIPCLVVRLLFRNNPEWSYTYMLYTGFGVILGHNFPFYLEFKGGKGIAATAGIIFMLDWRITLICAATFLLIFGLTRLVSLGSLVVSVELLAWNLVIGRTDYGLCTAAYFEYAVIACLICAMAYWRHRANIVRLANGKENKITFGKKQA